MLEIGNDALGAAPTGPWPDQAPHAANAARMSIHAAVSRWPQRIAAHNSGDTARILNVLLFTVSSSSGPKATKPVMLVARNAVPDDHVLPNKPSSRAEARKPSVAQRT